MAINRQDVTIGFVVKNNANQFLFHYVTNNGMVDVGLLDGELSAKEYNKDALRKLYEKHTGHDLSECGELNTLYSGRDRNGVYKIFFTRVDWTNTVSNNYIWLSLQEVERWHDEGRINYDQFSLIKKANKISFDALTKLKTKISEERQPNSRHMSIIQRRIRAGRFIKPTDKSEETVAEAVIRSGKHGSIQNFPNILNDEELLLKYAKISPNPLECSDYFYQFINVYIKSKRKFRIQFLRAIYLNDNVYTLVDIEKIVELYNLQKENSKLLLDVDLRNLLIDRLSNAQTFPKFDAQTYDSDKAYRKEKEKLVELNKAKELGLRSILEKFNKFQMPLEQEDEDIW